MALLKTITNAKGVTTNYHKIKDLTVNKVIANKKSEESVDKYNIEVLIFSYVSEDIRTASESYAAERKRISLEASLEEIDSTPIFKVAYDKLKETDTFKDAIDC